MKQIDRRAFTPLYYQVEQELLQQIQAGRLKPGDQLPSEAQISRQFGVSRITARRALENLEQKGLVYSQQGRGSFVAEGRIREMSGFRSFTEDIRSRGLMPSSQVVSLETIAPPEDIRQRARLEPGEQAYCLQRVRLADELPVAFETAYLPVRLCPGLEQHDLSNRSLYNILSESYGIHPTWADAEIDAALADAETARHLGMTAGDPVLRAVRLTYSETFEVIEYVLSVYRGDRFTFFTGRQYIGD